MANKIKAQLLFNEGSQLGALRIHLWHRYRFWIGLRTSLSAGLIITGIALTVYAGLEPLNILMLMVGTFALIRPQVWKIFHARNLRKLPGYGQAVLYTFSDDGIDIHGETRQAKVRWSQLHEILNHKKGIMLYHSPKAYTWIPREAFDCDQDFQQASELTHSLQSSQ